MSRLDSVIFRAFAQRACLSEAAFLVAKIDGPVIELGLGNGRTYDHLRMLLPNREIFVFDRKITAHPSCIPDDTHLFVGDLKDTLQEFLACLSSPAVLVHADLAGENKSKNEAVAKWLGPVIRSLIILGGVVVSDQKFNTPSLTPIEVPHGVQANRYFMYSAI